MTAENDVIIALHTYGSHRVVDPRTHQQVSAYKMGYTDATAEVLLTVYGAQAQDVSSPQAAYRYIKLDIPVTVRYGYLVVKITAPQLVQVEAITRRRLRPATYRWQSEQWWEFPNDRQGEYSEIAGRSGPSFSPASLLVTSPTTQEKTAAVAGISIERSQHDPNKPAWWWINGETYPHRELLKGQGAKFSGKRKAWYWVGWELPATIQQLAAASNDAPKPTPENPLSPMVQPSDDPCTVEEAAAILGLPLKQKPPGPTVNPRWLARQNLPAAPLAMPDTPPPAPPQNEQVEQALETIKNRQFKPSPVVAVPHKGLIPIGQQYVGELTGSVTGHVYCFGYAVHEGVLVYLNMGGPRMAVEAIRAKLSKGEIVNLVQWDGPAIELTVGENQTGRYTDFIQHIPEAKFTSCILAHEWVVAPNYGGKSTTFIFHTPDEQAKLKHHVHELVKIPVFDGWASYLWEAGRVAMLVRKTHTGGEIGLWTIDLDSDAWTRLLTGGLEQGVISLPRLDDIQSVPMSQSLPVAPLVLCRIKHR
ncbi:MAG: hypothetical protein HY862_02705 [Chloroflexi bacterium]|nr:hypothetical protein [Chloroflexota bacterium]